MKIDKENYEAWMLDYLEGRLSGKQLALFEQFLCEHPELRAEAEGLEDMTLEASDRFFEDKALLKAKMLKQVIDEEELTSFEAAEGELASDKKVRHDKRLQTSPRLQEKLQHYKEARLVADDAIVFEGKESLKRTEAAAAVAGGRERTLWPYMVAAAMMAGIVYLVIPKDETVGSKSDRRPMAALVEGKGKVEVKDEVKAKVEAKDEVKVEVKVKVKDEVKKDVQPSVAAAPKVTNPGAIIKHEAITAPKVDLAQRSNKVKRVLKPAKVKQDNNPVKEPYFYEEKVLAPEPAQIAQARPKKEVKPYVRTVKPAANPNRSAVSGTPNENFVKAETPQYADNRRKEDSNEIGKKSILKGSKFLARVTGDRLKIEEKGANKVSVKFETQLLGFSTTF